LIGVERSEERRPDGRDHKEHAHTLLNNIKAGAPTARLAMIKRFCISALPVLAAVGALTAIIALKAAIYYWRFH
jgi:hypothetical protein